MTMEKTISQKLIDLNENGQKLEAKLLVTEKHRDELLLIKRSNENRIKELEERIRELIYDGDDSANE